MNIYTYMYIIYPHSPKYNLFSPYNATCMHVFRTGPFGTEHSGEDHLLPFPAPLVTYSLDGGLTCVTFPPSIWRVHRCHPGSVRLLSDHFLSYCLPLWYPYGKWEQVIESICLLSPPLPAPSLLVSIRKWSEEGEGGLQWVKTSQGFKAKKANATPLTKLPTEAREPPHTSGLGKKVWAAKLAWRFSDPLLFPIWKQNSSGC